MPGQLHVKVLNVLEIAGWMLSHAPQLPALLRSEVGQAISFYSSTTNARYSPRHAIATTANGTYTAIDWYPLRRRIPTTTHTAPSPNTEVFLPDPVQCLELKKLC
jgi:hypothetical protein